MMGLAGNGKRLGTDDCLADDVAFADQLRTNPTRALHGYDLTTDELARLSRALESNARMVPSLFEPPAT